MTHSFSDDDLLAHVRGDAPEELSLRIEAEVSRDHDLEAEIALMRALKPALAAGAANPPGELGWRRLEAEIKREQASQRGDASASTPWLWKVAAVVFGLGVLGQGAYIVSTDGQPSYSTAGAVDKAHVVAIAFAPDAKASDISALLWDVGARVVDGPSTLGLYRVAFDSDEKLRSGWEAFESSGLVTLVADE